MKKLFLLLVLIGLSYGIWKYMSDVHDRTTENKDVLKQSEKALREMDE